MHSYLWLSICGLLSPRLFRWQGHASPATNCSHCRTIRTLCRRPCSAAPGLLLVVGLMAGWLWFREINAHTHVFGPFCGGVRYLLECLPLLSATHPAAVYTHICEYQRQAIKFCSSASVVISAVFWPQECCLYCVRTAKKKRICYVL